MSGRGFGLPYCSRCGAELASGVTFCTSCGARVGAPLAPPTPLQAKPSHTKRNLAIIVIVVILVGTVAAASSHSTSQGGIMQTTTSVLTSGSTVTFAEPFIVQDTDNVPVQMNFTGAWFQMGAGYDYVGATSPNKLFVVQFQMKNVGIRTTTVFSALSKWDVLVDKGYIYESELNFNFTDSVDPTQVVTNDVVFRILATTSPTQVRYYDTCAGSTADCSPTYTVDLNGVTIPAREELQFAGGAFCNLQQGAANLVNVTNTGLSPVTMATIYYDNQVVSSAATQVQPGETVSIPITIPSSIQPSSLQQYELKVVTATGNTFTTGCYYEGS